jgi:hypothetical protein
MSLNDLIMIIVLSAAVYRVLFAPRPVASDGGDVAWRDVEEFGDVQLGELTRIDQHANHPHGRLAQLRHRITFTLPGRSVAPLVVTRVLFGGAPREVFGEVARSHSTRMADLVQAARLRAVGKLAGNLVGVPHPPVLPDSAVPKRCEVVGPTRIVCIWQRVSGKQVGHRLTPNGFAGANIAVPAHSEVVRVAHPLGLHCSPAMLDPTDGLCHA